MASDLIQALKDDTFDAGIKEGLVLVDFWATWCPPCRALAPILEEIAEAYKGKIAIRKVDVDENKAVSMRFGVTNIPTMIVFKDGEQAQKIVGLHSREDLEDIIDGLL